MIDNLNWKNSEDVLINNIETSAIIEDADSTLTYFADKYIISNCKIATGDIVEYAGIKYIIISQIDRNIENRDEKEYNYKARMRQADYTIKMVIDSKVEYLPCIIDGQTFDIVANKIMDVSSDKIIVILKANEISNKISKTMRFIKMGSAWEIVGIDKTRKGLLILFCDSDTFGVDDDKINEIANTNLIKEPIEPDEPTIPETGVTYTITAEMPYADDVPEEIWLDSPPTVYTIHKFVDGVETSGIFTFEVTNISIVTITETTDNTVSIIANDFVGKKTTTLIATDTETGEIAIEFEILMCGR